MKIEYEKHCGRFWRGMPFMMLFVLLGLMIWQTMKGNPLVLVLLAMIEISYMLGWFIEKIR